MSYTLPTQRLAQQIQFILEADKLKTVLRRTRNISNQQYENSAEHSWQLALLALVLAEHANEPVNVTRVMKMVIIHDIVEIDAGDTFFFDDVGLQDKAEREQQAADRLFGLLPADQTAEMRGIWEEFEARETPEARFANSIDRIMPLFHNYHTQGGSWRENGVASSKVLPRMAQIGNGSETLWEAAQAIIHEAVAQGFLAV